MEGIPNKLTLFKVTFHGEAYVLAESKEKAKKTYREYANYLNEVIDEVNEKIEYNIKDV